MAFWIDAPASGRRLMNALKRCMSHAYTTTYACVRVYIEYIYHNMDMDMDISLCVCVQQGREAGRYIA